MKNEQIKRFRFYIGWNNDTKKREIKKAFSIVNKNNVLGFSKIDSVGFWNKDVENSFIIEVLSTTENPLTENQAIKIKLSLGNITNTANRTKPKRA